MLILLSCRLLYKERGQMRKIIYLALLSDTLLAVRLVRSDCSTVETISLPTLFLEDTLARRNLYPSPAQNWHRTSRDQLLQACPKAASFWTAYMAAIIYRKCVLIRHKDRLCGPAVLHHWASLNSTVLEIV